MEAFILHKENIPFIFSCNPRKWIYDSYPRNNTIENVRLRLDNNITSVLNEMYNDKSSFTNIPAAHREPIPNEFLSTLMRYGMFSNVVVQIHRIPNVNIWSKLNEMEKESLVIISLFWRKTVWAVKPCLGPSSSLYLNPR